MIRSINLNVRVASRSNPFFYPLTMAASALLASPGEATAGMKPGEIARITSPTSSEPDGNSGAATISNNGRYTAFVSSAGNLVDNDNNAVADAFVYDRKTGHIGRVSVSTFGSEADGQTSSAWISANGRFIAFASEATNLVPGDTNGKSDVFLHDRKKGNTTRVSVGSGGTQASGDSYFPSVSKKGRYIAFESKADNLMPGDTNGVSDVYVHDRKTGMTTLVSASPSGFAGNGSSLYARISANGRYVVYTTNATDLAISDWNSASDVLLHDLKKGTTEVMSIGTGGSLGNGASLRPSISNDGRYVAFTSDATGLVSYDTNAGRDVFLRDRKKGTLIRVSVADSGLQANGSCYRSEVSPKGRFVAFWGTASTLVSGDTNGSPDVFLYDNKKQTLSRESVSKAGVQGNAKSAEPTMSLGAKYIAFGSFASNLSSSDTNGKSDIFVRRR